MNDLYDYSAPDPSSIYHDLRQQQDDKAVLRNPHKGWYFHYVDNGMRFPLYRNTLRPGEDLHFLPGLNHLYLRIDWSDVEPEEGKFTWEKVDEILDTWGKKGYHFSIRLCAFETNRPMISYATPEWVFKAGARGEKRVFQIRSFFLQMGIGEEGKEYFAMEPDYGDPIFLEKLAHLMEAYGKKYNGHPLIDFVDVGTFGPWGEGHSQRQYSPQVLKTHVDLHLRAFPDTFVLINDDMIKHCAGADVQASRELVDYCAAHHMGFRDDSLYVTGYCKQYGFDMLSIPTAFDHFWRTGPVDLESGHQQSLALDGVMDGGFRMIEAMRRTHATYSGFHGDPYRWYEQYAAYHDYAANRLGYWYFIEGYSLPTVTEGISPCLTLRVSNRGFAPAYHRYAFRIMAVDEAGKEYLLHENGPDNREWMCGETAEARVRLETRALKKGKYRLYVGLFSGERPVLFAMKAERRTEKGYHLLGEMEIR